MRRGWGVNDVVGFSKVVTIVFGLICSILLGFNYSKPYRRVQFLNITTNVNDLLYERRHVIEDEACLAIVIILLILSTAWFAIFVFNKPFRNTNRRRGVDILIHALSGLIMVAIGILWFHTVFSRSISFETYNASNFGDPKARKTVLKAFESFGYFNLVLRDIDMNRDSGKVLHGLPLFPHRYDYGRFISLIIAGVFVGLNAVVYFIVAIMLVLKKVSTNNDVIDPDADDEDTISISEVYSDPGRKIKIAIIVFGIISVPLSGTAYNDSYYDYDFYYQELERRHSNGEEIAFSVVTIFFGFSVLWALVFITELMRDTLWRKILDTIYHLVAGVLIIFVTIMWVINLASRSDTSDTPPGTGNPENRQFQLTGDRGLRNRRWRYREDFYYQSDGNNRYLQIIFSVIFMLIDSVLYLVLGGYLISKLCTRNPVQPNPEIPDNNSQASEASLEVASVPASARNSQSILESIARTEAEGRGDLPASSEEGLQIPSSSSFGLIYSK